ncbi:hypothetical protein OROMI_019292 [Orobanche minor]
MKKIYGPPHEDLEIHISMETQDFAQVLFCDSCSQYF